MTFAVEAQRQIIECRKLLKWDVRARVLRVQRRRKRRRLEKKQSIHAKTHEISETRVEFYEYVQGEAENRLEQLTRFMERDLKISETMIKAITPKPWSINKKRQKVRKICKLQETRMIDRLF